MHSLTGGATWLLWITEKEASDGPAPGHATFDPSLASGQLNLFVWVDIDEATRPQMLKSSVNRREQMVSDGLQLTLDLDHWNSSNPTEEPIELPMDLSLDIAIRKAADDEDDDKEAA